MQSMVDLSKIIYRSSPIKTGNIIQIINPDLFLCATISIMYGVFKSLTSYSSYWLWEFVI